MINYADKGVCRKCNEVRQFNNKETGGLHYWKMIGYKDLLTRRKEKSNDA